MAEKEDVSEILFDTSAQDFLDWRQHPMTKVFRRFLADYREQLRRDHLGRWETHPDIDVPHEAEARGRLLTVTEMHDLRFEDIQAFYKQEAIDESETG